MAMVFRYFLEPTAGPVLSLGGRWSRPQPIIPVSLVGPTAAVARDCRLDSGADDTVFPEWVAVRCGVDLTAAPQGTARAVGVLTYPVRFAQARLRVTDGVEMHEWPAWLGFTTARMVPPLLGIAGFLQFFTTTLRGDREEVELEANALLPGP
jgi:hypothetical protein